MSLNDETKAAMLPAIEKLSDASGDSVESIFTEIENKGAEYISGGMEEADAFKTAFNSVKASYRYIIKLGAEIFEGIFIGATATSDSNDFDRKNAQRLLDEFIDNNGGEDSIWKPGAFKAGLINEKGDLTYSREFIDEFKRGNTKLDWMIGKTIDVNMRKTAYGIFHRKDTDDEFEFFTCYINDPDNFIPEFNKMYSFRAAQRNPNRNDLTLYKTVSRINEIAVVDMEEIESMMSVLGDNFREINTVYELEAFVAESPEAPNPKFWITNAVIDSFESTGYGMTKVSVIDQFGDYDDDPVEMDIATEYATNIHEGALGIAVYRPFVRRGKESRGEEEGEPIPSGNLYGFIVDSRFSPSFDMNINEEEYVEEY